MSAKKYVKYTVINIEVTLTKKYMQLPTIHSPMPANYHPSKDVSNRLNERVVQAYQELIGEIQWAVEIGRVNNFLEVALLSSNLDFPQSDHLQAVY